MTLLKCNFYLIRFCFKTLVVTHGACFSVTDKIGFKKGE